MFERHDTNDEIICKLLVTFQTRNKKIISNQLTVFLILNLHYEKEGEKVQSRG
jgi:hypothetical protein